MSQEHEEVIGHLRDMQPAMKNMAETIHHGNISDVADYIFNADIVQCKAVIDLLIERVSTLVGCATELEDAACSLANEIAIKGSDAWWYQELLSFRRK